MFGMHSHKREASRKLSVKVGKLPNPVGRLLTKAMDASMLRQCLAEGRYSLFDETSALKERADRRHRLAWLKGSRKTDENIQS